MPTTDDSPKMPQRTSPIDIDFDALLVDVEAPRSLRMDLVRNPQITKYAIATLYLGLGDREAKQVAGYVDSESGVKHGVVYNRVASFFSHYVAIHEMGGLSLQIVRFIQEGADYIRTLIDQTDVFPFEPVQTLVETWRKASTVLGAEAAGERKAFMAAMKSAERVKKDLQHLSETDSATLKRMARRVIDHQQ